MSEPTGWLLDTHAWFWLVAGDPRVQPALVARLEEAGRAGRVHLSQISTWEIAVKEGAGKLKLNQPIATWLAAATTGLRLVDLSVPVVVDATRLPGELHRDPADRLIVATARHLGLTLVTADEAILRYARGGHVRVEAL